MALHINFVCDERIPEPNPDFPNEEAPTRLCQSAQPVSFDAEHETYGDLLAHMRGAGWELTMDGARVVSARCPSCTVRASVRRYCATCKTDFAPAACRSKDGNGAPVPLGQNGALVRCPEGHPTMTAMRTACSTGSGDGR